jgi:uncharacterized membrane protein/nitrite reductase/ring-hydroxylating ferredoxin subunit
MRSAATFKSHPIHPALTHFPIAFLYAALVMDAGALLADRPAWGPVGFWLAAAGIGCGLLAAIPGLVDYLRTVPPGSSARTRATKHMLVNVGSLAAFGLSLLLRGSADGVPGVFTVGLELLGAVLITMGGWMGATLMTRNMIGIDHRHAGAGRWNEADIDPPADGVLTAAESGELEVGQMKLLRVGERRIVLARNGDGYAAFDDACSHRGGSLADGTLICGTVLCLWHGSQFDTRSGAVQAGPAERGIRIYEAWSENGTVGVRL